MKILFIHQNFPGQFRHLAAELADDPANTVLAIGEEGHLGRLGHPRVREIGYKKPNGAGKKTHFYLHDLEAAVRRGQQVVRVCLALAAKGFVPDVVYCHPGWGEGLFLRDVWPHTRLLYFFEFFYNATGFDADFDQEFPRSVDARFRTRIRRANLLTSAQVADWGISPTHWQLSSLPPEYHSKTSVIFDGIDTERVRPDPNAHLHLSEDLVLTRGDEVITFAVRNLEPYRGYHIFMRALPEILRRRPQAQIVIVGGDDVSYGRQPPEGRTWKEVFLNEVQDDLDLSRVHFMGKLPYGRYLDVLRVSSVHLYLTYPFVLSWSMLEAMSAGCLVVGSRTPPVEEVIVDGDNGMLVDFFDVAGFTDAVDRALDHPDRMQALRVNARRTVVRRYDLKKICLPAQIEVIRTLAAGRLPSSGVRGSSANDETDLKHGIPDSPIQSSAMTVTSVSSTTTAGFMCGAAPQFR